MERFGLFKIITLLLLFSFKVDFSFAQGVNEDENGLIKIKVVKDINGEKTVTETELKPSDYLKGDLDGALSEEEAALIREKMELLDAFMEEASIDIAIEKSIEEGEEGKQDSDIDIQIKMIDADGEQEFSDENIIVKKVMIRDRDQAVGKEDSEQYEEERIIIKKIVITDDDEAGLENYSEAEIEELLEMIEANPQHIHQHLQDQDHKHYMVKVMILDMEEEESEDLPGTSGTEAEKTSNISDKGLLPVKELELYPNPSDGQFT